MASTYIFRGDLFREKGKKLRNKRKLISRIINLVNIEKIDISFLTMRTFHRLQFSKSNHISLCSIQLQSTKA